MQGQRAPSNTPIIVSGLCSPSNQTVEWCTLHKTDNRDEPPLGRLPLGSTKTGVRPELCVGDGDAPQLAL